MHQKREDLLKTVKSNCDAEMKQFVEILTSQLSHQTERRDEYSTILDKMSHFANMMIELTPEEIIEGKCTEIVDQVKSTSEKPSSENFEFLGTKITTTKF